LAQFGTADQHWDSPTYDVAAKNAATFADVGSSAGVAQNDTISGAILPPNPIDLFPSIASHKRWQNVVSDIAFAPTSVKSETVARQVASVNLTRVNQVLGLQSDDTRLPVWNESDSTDDLPNVFDDSWLPNWAARESLRV